MEGELALEDVAGNNVNIFIQLSNWTIHPVKAKSMDLAQNHISDV